MIINFVGNFQTGYVGESADESHIARELEEMGHTVRRIPRDEWREYVREKSPKDKYGGVPAELRADINIIAKWHHFYNGSFIEVLKKESEAPVFYWVWDYMMDEEWHIEMASVADLYLSGELGKSAHYKNLSIPFYYFQYDACDGDLPIYKSTDKLHDVIFTGSCIGQGNRKEWLQIINKEVPVKIFGWGHEDWKNLGFEAYEPIYGKNYNELISRSKIVLGFNVETNCYGYWSNRVGKVIRAGGFLLQEFTPGMESFLPLDRVDFFSSPKEAIQKIKYHLDNPISAGHSNGERFTSKDLVKRLTVLIERYLKGEPKEWKI